jgi:hypothetical protein
MRWNSNNNSNSGAKTRPMIRTSNAFVLLKKNGGLDRCSVKRIVVFWVGFLSTGLVLGVGMIFFLQSSGCVSAEGSRTIDEKYITSMTNNHAIANSFRRLVVLAP